MKPVEIGTTGWCANSGEPREVPAELQDATVRIDGPLPQGRHAGKMLLSVEVVVLDDGRGFDSNTVAYALLPEPLPKALRRLETFRRGQGRIDAEMDSADELRALGVLARTLEQLDAAALRRALQYLNDRYGGCGWRAPMGLSVPESLALARERLRRPDVIDMDPMRTDVLGRPGLDPESAG